MDVSSFDLAGLTPAFLHDPYPTYRALQQHDPCTSCRMARCS